jgi:glycosyltransferase involved in cell wall biosynthesis
MKVLHIQKIAGIAGAEAHLLLLLPRLRQHGYEPHMIALQAPGNQPQIFIDQLEASGVTCETMSMRGHIDPTLSLRLARRIRRLQPALVHTHLFHADLYGALALSGSRIPLVSTKHGFDLWRSRRLYGWMDRMAARRAQKIIVISAAIGDWHWDVESLPRDKMRVVHYGLDPLTFRAQAGPSERTNGNHVRIGVVSRLIEQKGVDTLLRAFALLHPDCPRTKLQIVGDGPARLALVQLARDLKIDDRVAFLGYRSDISAVIRDLDVLAFPTHGEGFGLVVLEAWAWSKPVVASAVTSLPEIIGDNQSGLLVPPRDERALAAALKRLVQDPELRRTLGDAGRGRLEREFTVEAMTSRTADVYNDVLRRLPVTVA